MTSDFDVSQYLGLFLDEAEEQLQILDESIILLEHDKENMDLLNTIFRAAHTLKGSSASMGFDNIAHLTHAMESVLDRLRHRDIAVTTEIADLLLEALDNLRVFIQNVANEDETDPDVSELINNLKQVAQGEAIDTSQAVTSAVESTPAYSLDDVETNVIQSAFVKGYNVWHIVVRLVSGCLMKAARAYIVFNNLKDAGEVVKTIPSTEEIEEEKFDDTFDLLI
jgi:two-component system chemotaxis sensor kinase CheA